MDASNFYLFVVSALFLLTIFDLVVGVSNDAVNFLNSAIGSQVAKRQTIMIVASAGILIGALTSGGMMEVARKGIFNPEHFYFDEVMVIFLAVMITDIILLDLFNTFALPTSTTVSIVFEILGASLAISVIKVLGDGSAMNYLFNTNNSAEGVIGYMNWEKAGTIIIGIFLSVIIAFSIGALVQFVSRLLFTFQYERRLKFLGPIWGGIAMTALAFFLIYKGMGAMVKNTNPETIQPWQIQLADTLAYVQEHLWVCILFTYLLCTFILFVLQGFRFRALRFVVLFGTFSLAMAFAGNDLVNFVGVPIAGWQAWSIWNDSGIAPEAFSMNQIQGKVATPYFLLVLAGIIMIVTLWLSKKARSVTETEVNLGAQSDVDERFKSNMASRALVRLASKMNEGFVTVLPPAARKKISKSFEPAPELDEKAKPAFDLVRATVNLSVASVLIAIATNMKLPLSTTYVSFMVAMGTSLADRAWGRESAVYRVAGVMSVVGGWLMTAFVALLAAGIFASLLYFGGLPAVIGLLIVVGLIIYKSSNYHSINLLKKKKAESKANVNYKDVTETIDLLSTDVGQSLSYIRQSIDNSFEGLYHEDLKQIKEAEKAYSQLNEEYSIVQKSLFKIIKRNSGSDPQSSKVYLLTYDLMQDMMQSLQLVVDSCSTFVKNSHKPLTREQIFNLTEIQNKFNAYLDFLNQSLEENKFDLVTDVNALKKEILDAIDALLVDQIEGVKAKEYGYKNSSLYFTLLLEMKDIVAISARFIKLYSRML